MTGPLIFLTIAVTAFGLWLAINAKTGPQSTMGTALAFFGAIVLLIMLVMMIPAHARDLGQWEASDPVVKQWYKSLMRPDVPTMSCCGEADAYWADEVHVRDGKTFATITDDRPDEPLGRPHIPVGTVVEIPPEKLKWDRSNPTGHSVVFLTTFKYVYCFVQGSGT